MKKTVTRRDFIKKSSKIAAFAGLGGSGFLLKGCDSKQGFDIVIKEGMVFDGLGNEGFIADIGIIGDTIKEIGKIPSSTGKIVIDAKNFVVCPGFIDAHDHSDIELLVNPNAESHIRQGITTLVSGNCGSSFFPIAEEIFEERKENLWEEYQIELTWKDIKGFFSALKNKGMAINYSTLVGHGDIRGAAMGFNDRPPKSDELEKMKALVAENIKNGALGISSGLEYSPGSYAQADEIVELCRVAAQNGGVYASHMRDESDKLLESLEETIDVARKSGVRLQISHFKVAYPRNWNKIDKALSKLDKAREEGVKIFCDRYPYIAGSTGLSFYFPLWARQGTTQEFLSRLKDSNLEDKLRFHVAKQEEKLRTWDNVVISSVFTEKNKKFEGMSILQGARETRKDAFAFMRDLLIEEENRVDMVIFMMKEENLRRILAHPLVGIGCDGSTKAPYGKLAKGKPHPRSYGTFPRVLGKYIRQEKIVPMPEMLKKMTSIPARNFDFKQRGVLRKEFIADIVIFDADRVIDKSTWEKPHQYPEGIEYVLVNGQIVIEGGEHSGKLPGQILMRGIQA